MNRTAFLTAFLSASLLAIPAMAQPAGAPARGAGPAMVGQPVLGGPGKKAGNPAARLGIDAPTAQKVKQIHQKYRAERQAILQRIGTHRQQLVQLLRSDSNDQNAYRNAINGLKTAREQLQASKDREMAELQKTLTPKQQAKLMAAMHRRANNGKQRGGPAPRGRRGQNGQKGSRGNRGASAGW